MNSRLDYLEHKYKTEGLKGDIDEYGHNKAERIPKTARIKNENTRKRYT